MQSLSGIVENDVDVSIAPRVLGKYYFKESDLAVKSRWLDALVLGKVDKDRISHIKRCNDKGIFLVYSCIEHSSVNVVRPFSPCNEAFCLFDAGRYSVRKGAELYGRIKAVPANAFGHFVFGVPSKYWPMMYSHESCNRLKETVRKTLDRFFKCKMGGMMRVHVWGDKKVEWLGRKEPHVHVLMPLLGFDRIGRPHHYDFWIGKARLRLMQRIYREELVREFGFEVDEVDFYYRYILRKDPYFDERLMNCCQYIMRPPLELPLRPYFHKECNGNELAKLLSFGVERYVAILEHFKFYKGWRSMNWWGWMASHVVKKYLGKLKVNDRELSRIFGKHDWRICSICGGKLVLSAMYSNNELVLMKDLSEVPLFNGLVSTGKAVKVSPLPHDLESLKMANPLASEWFLKGYLGEKV